MNTFRHDEEQRRQWVLDKIHKRKSVKRICQEAQISRATLYNWISEMGEDLSTKQEQASNQPPDTGEAPVLPARDLPVYHAATRHRMLLAALEKVDVDKSIARKLAATLVKRFTLSISQACEITGIDETTYGYKPRKPEADDLLVQQSIVQLLAENPTKSFDQCYTELRQVHPDWTRKQIKRVYREGRLYLKRRRSRKPAAGEAQLPPFPVHHQRPGAIWNVGITETATGKLLFILDDADTVLLNTEKIEALPTQEELNAFLNRAMVENGKPRRLRVPDMPPFNIREITGWAFQNKLSLLTLSLSKPENELEVQGMIDSAKEQWKG